MAILRKFKIKTSKVVEETHLVYAEDADHAQRLVYTASPRVLFSESKIENLKIEKCAELLSSVDDQIENKKRYLHTSELLEVMLDCYLNTPEAYGFFDEEEAKKQSVIFLREFFINHYSKDWTITEAIEQFMNQKGLEYNFDNLLEALNLLPDSFYINFIRGKDSDFILTNLLSH